MQNRIVNLKNANGMWVKLHPRHNVIHFVQMGSKLTLCDIVVPEKIFTPENDNKNCPSCKRIILELEPGISTMLESLED